MFNLTRLTVSMFGISGLMLVGMVACVATTDTVPKNPCSATHNPCSATHNPCNPCSTKNPCSATHNTCNPLATKNPCSTTHNTCNPCAAKNPCSSSSKIIIRPTGTKLMTGNKAELLAEGKKMWADTSLSTNGMACQTCHQQGKAAFGESFAKSYPHTVGMVKEKFGLEQVELDEMIQFCIVEPMVGKALAWESKELAALTAYTNKLQQEFK
ncbi:MAG TPA: hypothetical protein ENK59_02345 [Thioploca sp.]|nr:hypothetical protein [Thioploca sp.]